MLPKSNDKMIFANKSSNISKIEVTPNNTTTDKEIRYVANELIKSQEKNIKKYEINPPLPSISSSVVVVDDNNTNEKIQNNKSGLCIHELLSNDPILKTQVCNLM
uniref:Uncharacterized protein n=1 Tax=Parastrongyloides trichosuri TaxID=131310 RepID=A0A0N4Z0N5_PARTI